MSSYTHQVKEELARYPIKNHCCAFAELRAMMELRGELGIGAHKYRLIVQTEHAFTARRIFSLFKRCFALAPLVFSGRRRLRQKNAFYVQVGGKETVLSVLQKLEFLAIDPEEGKYLLHRQKGGLQTVCCRRAYLRGAFLAGGSLNNPARDYHLEIICPCESYARSVVEVLAVFGLPARYFQRKDNQVVVYIKEGEKISEFLRIIAAHGGLLRFENVRVLKGVRNKINRLVNCETANLARTALAAYEQLSNIQLVTAALGLENIPSSLREVARLRLSYPEATLKELGGLACPPLTKSMVNHRLRRIGALARKINGQE